MGSLLIVEAKPSKQVSAALCAGAIEAAVRPFTEHRLNEALSLAVRSRRVGTGSLMPQLQTQTSLAESVRAIAGAVVCEQGFDSDALVPKPGARATRELSAGLTFLVGQDLCVGDSREVVDGDVDELPSSLIAATGRAHARDAMTGFAEAAQLLDVQVQQLAGMPPLIPSWRDRGLEALERTEATSVEHGADRRSRQFKLCSDEASGLLELPQPHNHLDPRTGQRVGPAVGRRAAIAKTAPALLTKAPKPLVRCPAADSGGRGRLLRAPALLAHTVNEQVSTGGRGPCILMNVHPGYLQTGLIGSHQSASRV